MGINDHYDKIISLIEKPYFRDLESMGVTEDHYKEIFKRVFNVGIKVKYNLIEKEIRNEDGYLLYFEDSDGEWMEQYFNDNGNIIYYENSNGYQRIYKYDEDGLIIVE